MSRSRKITLLVLGSLIALALAATAALFLLDLNALRPRIESAASHALGMELHINGRVGIGFPNLSLSLNDAQLRNRDATVADVEEVRLDMDLIALFRNDIQVREVALNGATLFIERAADGRLNIEQAKPQRGERRGVNLAKLTIRDARLYYADVASGTDVEARGCDIDGSALHIAPGTKPPLLKLSVNAKATCENLRAQNIEFADVKFAASVDNGVLKVDPITMKLFGGDGSADLHADFSKPESALRLRYSLAGFRIEESLRMVTQQEVAHGNMDFSLELSARGTTWAQMKQAMSGRVALRGKYITVKGGNLDEELSRFESSQRFNLVDVGAFFFAGPMGLALTKGFSFASILTAGKGVSHIRAIVSEWNIEHGMAKATDAAISTNRYRIALQGELDLVNERFKDVTVALVDDAGCPKVRQKISGPFREPAIERPNVLTALAGPALNLLSGARNFVTRRQCTAFYTGSVPPPTQKQAERGASDATK